MTDEKTKTGFRESVGLLLYGFGLVARLAPSYLPLILVRSLINAAQPLTVLFLSARILNELSGARDVQTIISYVAVTVGLTFALSAARAAIDWAVDSVAGWEKVYGRMLTMEAERFATMDFAHAEDSKVSEILARMDTTARGNGLGLANLFFIPPAVAESVFSLAFSVLLLTGLSAGGGLTGIQAAAVYGLFAIGMLVTLRYRAAEKKLYERVYAENAKANTAAPFYMHYLQTDRAAKDVRIYDQSETIEKIFNESFDTKHWLKTFFFGSRLGGFNLALLTAVGGAFYLLIGYNALNGSATAGGIVQGVGAAMAFAGALGSMVSMLGQLYNNAPFLKPMREFLNLPDILVKGSRDVPVGEGRAHQFEFVNVSFKYPGSEDFALRNLNLKLSAGERTAVVGPNGSGKTTMIKLLCRLYDPTDGEILLDGINIKEYDYAQYISLFSVVFQDYSLFPLWLGQNVAASENVNEKRALDCLTGAGFAERLSEMPERLETILYKSFDENGTQISGGEAQKIALARALYRDAPIVVLDEPTAALDPIAEYEVYTAFDEIIGEKTAVFISHRLSSCRFCHDIAVFEKGRLAQRGGHEELLSDEGGLYYTLWNAQAKHYVDE